MSAATALAIETKSTQPAKTTKRSGPRTARGKAAVKLNSVRHGVFSKADTLPWESQKAFRKFVMKRLDYFAPEELYERELVEDIARLEWRMRRLDVYENAALIRNAVDQVIDPELHCFPLPPVFVDNPEKLRELFRQLADIGKQLDQEVKRWYSKYNAARDLTNPI